MKTLPIASPTFVTDALWARGFARLGRVLSRETCTSLRSLYGDAALFRSKIDMARYRFGQGEYQYFAYPLPEPVADLRGHFYGLLAPIATDWMAALGMQGGFPAALGPFLETCHAGGQSRPTPLLLRYRSGDYNCLHQDLYGPIVFPFQVIICLSDAAEFEGGELLLVEQRPRAQSIGHALRLEQGEAVAITTRYRPIKGARGYYRGTVRHGVSEVSGGERFTLGLPFHDAA